jgi:hypothetical protein
VREGEASLRLSDVDFHVFDLKTRSLKIILENGENQNSYQFGSVLRVETVVNDPYSFKILRHGRRGGDAVYGWFPMAKGVANLYRLDG